MDHPLGPPLVWCRCLKALKMLALDVKIRQLHHGYLVIWIQKSMVAKPTLCYPKGKKLTLNTSSQELQIMMLYVRKKHIRLCSFTPIPLWISMDWN
jgi:hypothetical protein